MSRKIAPVTSLVSDAENKSFVNLGRFLEELGQKPDWYEHKSLSDTQPGQRTGQSLCMFL